jgi:hypothetical protein
VKKIIRPLALMLALAVGAIGLSACESSELQKREQKQAAKADPNRVTLEKVNLTKKKELEENPSAVRYVYLMNFGQIVGYYVAKGKISSSGSQLTPEQDIVDLTSSSCCEVAVVDGPQDDGTYGEGDPGIFFFLADGTMVETSLDYITSTQPIPIDVPRLDPKK